MPARRPRNDLWRGLLATLAIGAFAAVQRDGLLVMLVSPDLARTAGIDVRRLNVLFLIAFALTIALHYLGVLIPAATLFLLSVVRRR